MKKTERHNGIVHLLRTRGRMTASGLAAYFEVSERTVYRDIDALSQLHVPIIAYEGLGGGYEIDSAYFMPSIKLSEQEILMLLMVLKAGEELRIPNMAPDYRLLISKVLNALSDRERQEAEQVMSRIEFDLIRIMPKGYIQGVLSPLLESFRTSRDLMLSYHHPERDESVSRRFSPLQLFFADGAWYVSGYCHMRQAKRTFRLDRIEALSCLAEENRHLDSPLPRSEDDKFRNQTYELIIDPALYRIVKDDIYLQHSVVEKTASDLHLTVTTPFKNDIRHLVLSRPDQVTALGPADFLEELNQLGQAISKKYLKP